VFGQCSVYIGYGITAAGYNLYSTDGGWDESVTDASTLVIHNSTDIDIPILGPHIQYSRGHVIYGMSITRPSLPGRSADKNNHGTDIKVDTTLSGFRNQRRLS
jgi:hypothetical protein